MAKNQMAAEEMYLSVEDFYEGKSVFITGGTGYLGKVLIEKLLYSCPKIKTIYMLIRDKKSINAADRLQHILDMPVFSRLKERKPECLKKIVPIVGHIEDPGLDISPEDKETLIEEVSVVIHSAATIKFTEPLEVALKINLEGTRNVLELSRMMKNIQVFLYISTAYSNTDQKIVEEMVYPPPAKLDAVYEFVRQFGDVKARTVEFLNGRPNTYTYTKALAETLVAESHGDVPVVIVRPAIVTASEKEPLPGWLDNWFGPTAVVTTVGKGACRVIRGEAKNLVDFIPVDYVSNLIVVAAARCKRSEAVSVYNSCTSWCNPLPLGEMFELVCKESVKHKFNDLPYPGVMFTKLKWLINLISGLQLLMAYMGDLFRRVRGKSPRYLKNQTRANYVRDILDYFTSHSWIIRCDRTRSLHATLSAPDKKKFPFDPKLIDWTQYMHIYFMGIQKYLLNPMAASVKTRQSQL